MTRSLPPRLSIHGDEPSPAHFKAFIPWCSADSVDSVPNDTEPGRHDCSDPRAAEDPRRRPAGPPRQSRSSPKPISQSNWADGLVQPERKESAPTPTRAPRDSRRRLGEVRGVRAHRHSREVRAQHERLPELRLSSSHSGHRLLQPAARRRDDGGGRGRPPLHRPARLPGISGASQEEHRRTPATPTRCSPAPACSTRCR